MVLHNCVRGSGVVVRLVYYYPSRFIAYGFLAYAYAPPSQNFDYEAILAMAEKSLGYVNFGYWKFLAEESNIIKDHVSPRSISLKDYFLLYRKLKLLYCY